MLFYVEKPAPSRKNTFGAKRRQKCRNFFEKPKNFRFFKIWPPRAQFRIFSKFFRLKKYLIFNTILWSKPHQNPFTPKKVMLPQKSPKFPQKGYPFGNKGWDKIFEFWPQKRLIWCFDTRWVRIRRQKNFKKFLQDVRVSKRFATFANIRYNFSRLKWTPNILYLFLTARGRSFELDI